MAIISGITIAIEIIIVKHLMKFGNDADKLETNMISFSLRVYSVGFISLFLIYEYYTKDGEIREKYKYTMCNNRNFWTLLVAGAFSAVTVLTYYKALNDSPNAGAVSAIRLLYVPLLFIGGLIFLKEKVSHIKWYGWLGASMVVIGGVFVGIGVEKEEELIL